MRFATFGCWNNSNNTKDENKEPYFNDVIDTFNLVDKDSTDFVVVTGDNYYPKKIKTDKGKYSVFEDTHFSNGFNKLKSIEKKVYLLMGNHDLQYENWEKPKEPKEPKELKETEETSLVNPDKCHIINKIITESNSIPNIDIKTKIFIEENNLFIFLNTNYFDTSIKMEDCNSIYENEQEKQEEKGKTEQEEKQDEEGKMMEYINKIKSDINKKIKSDNSNIQNVFIFGHHPIYASKQKTTETPKEIKIKSQLFNKDGIELIYDICSEFTTTRVYYICADVHQYQSSTLEITKDNKTITIPQYVVGTGGAKLDDCVADNTVMNRKMYDEFGIKYTRNDDCKTEYGYLSVYIPDDITGDNKQTEPTFTFTNISDTGNDNMGKKGGTTKKKNKFSKKKHINNSKMKKRKTRRRKYTKKKH